MHIQVITNTEGSGDWMVVRANGETVYNGSALIRPHELFSLLLSLCGKIDDVTVGMVSVTDEKMEEIA